jgi:hypothetical protein
VAAGYDDEVRFVGLRGKRGEVMAIAEAMKLDLLYGTDETAWLEVMAALAAEGRYGEMDYPNLSEYLAAMTKRDRREVFSRLVVLLTHLLKSAHQPDRQGGSWRATIREQRRELRQLLESATLRNHATAILADAYAEARRQAADETELDRGVFPPDNTWDLNAILGDPDA